MKRAKMIDLFAFSRFIMGGFEQVQCFESDRTKADNVRTKSGLKVRRVLTMACPLFICRTLEESFSNYLNIFLDLITQKIRDVTYPTLKPAFSLNALRFRILWALTDMFRYSIWILF